MRLSSRVGRIGESATLRVSRRAAGLRAQGVDVVDLGAGEPDFASPPVAVEAARRALAEGFTKYTPSNGIPELRGALAARFRDTYGAPWQARDVVVTVGAKAALFELALALLDPSDEVVIPTPCWVSFPEQIRFAGAEPVEVPLEAGDGFRVRAEPLIEAMTDRTRAVLVNSPSNPTGGVIGEADLERLVAACAERGVVLIADETYERFVYAGEHASAARLAARHPETVVLVGSFSKTYAMTGWRIGYVFGPPEVIAAVGNVQSHATSNPTSFAMVGAVSALAEAEPDVERMIATYRKRRAFLIPRLNELPGVSCEPPAGAFYAFPRVAGAYRDGCRGSIAFAEALLEEAAVAVVPGEAFGDDDHVRISFACSTETLERGLERMRAFLG
jgi:aspartate aminotransferase